MNEDLSPEEQKLIKQIEEGKQEGGYGASLGSGIGTVAGGTLGGILGAVGGFGFGALPGATGGAALGGGIGSALGGLIGTATGGSKVESAEKRLAALQASATKGDVEKQARQAAFEKLLGKYNTNF